MVRRHTGRKVAEDGIDIARSQRGMSIEMLQDERRLFVRLFGPPGPERNADRIRQSAESARVE